MTRPWEVRESVSLGLSVPALRVPQSLAVLVGRERCWCGRLLSDMTPGGCSLLHAAERKGKGA